MPTYDYVCAACGHAFEHFQDMSAKRLRTCPRCKKPKLERQVGTGSGLIFKGSGFYITDYRRSGGADAAAAPAGEKKGTGGNESKGAGGNADAPSAPASPPAAGGPAKAEAPKPPPKPSQGRSGK